MGVYILTMRETVKKDKQTKLEKLPTKKKLRIIVLHDYKIFV